MNKLEAVFFDLDGTLINTLGDIAYSYNKALQQHGLPTHEVEKYKNFVGNGTHVLSQRICGEHNNKVDDVNTLATEIYKNNLVNTSEPYLGIEDALEVLHSRGIKLAVLTNKPDFACQKIIAAFFPKNLFELVQGMKEGMKTKPNPETILSMCENMDVDPKNCMMVGDSSVDMETALNAGIIPVGVEWGFRTVEELSGHGAALLLEEPADITSLPELYDSLD